MAQLLRQDFALQLNNKIIDIFLKEYAAVPMRFGELFPMRTIEESYIQEMSYTSSGLLTEIKEGEVPPLDTMHDGWVTYGSTRLFGKSMQWSNLVRKNEADIEAMILRDVSSWGTKAAMTMDKFYSDLFNKGALLTGSPEFNNSVEGVFEDPSGNFIYDLKPWFAGAGNGHPLKAAPGIAIENYFPLPLTLENFIAVWKHFTLEMNRNEKNEPIDLKPDTLLIHPALELEAEEILGTKMWPSKDHNVSAMNPAYNRVNVVTWHNFANEDAWVLLKRGNGMQSLVGSNLDIRMVPDELTQVMTAICRMQFGATIKDWRYACGCNLPQV